MITLFAQGDDIGYFPIQSILLFRKQEKEKWQSSHSKGLPGARPR